ncbi:hypothetical protein MNB_ARC-1_1124 [hydrothermal vent metagenome]|uniref:TonB C-terminal domain-containing protein n=1 Tax=hydrothermal vent metagenome TaxID=652676 RepID=A0A3B1E5N6_9ZZZZ
MQSNGSVTDIKTISGRKVLRKSVVRAIKSSFPMEADKTLFSFPKKFTIKLSFSLT